tara:strand:+ start:666 stop:797 length:132 start_codon:yes stop_codon:yes gene_type:complete
MKKFLKVKNKSKSIWTKLAEFHKKKLCQMCPDLLFINKRKKEL